jgi:ATP-dependent DNA ligase
MIYLPPVLVFEVEFLKLTSEGKFRVPKVKLIRSNKAAEQCRLPSLPYVS